jgi:hypothetical protein
MNIQEFKNNLVGGGARSNLFRVNGTFPAAAVAAAGINPSASIQFMCRAAQIPEATLGVVEVPFQGRIFKLAGDRSFQPWAITVYNDTNFSLRKAFEAWHNQINKIESNIGRVSPAEYFQQWTVTQIDRAGKDVQTYTFVDCWPSAVQAIELNYEQTTTIEQFTVELQYQYYQIRGVSD